MINVENNGANIEIKGLVMNGKERTATLYKRMTDSNGDIFYLYSIPELGIRLSEVIAQSPENAVAEVLHTIRTRMESIVEDAKANIELLDEKVTMREVVIK